MAISQTAAHAESRHEVELHLALELKATYSQNGSHSLAGERDVKTTQSAASLTPQSIMSDN